MATMNMDVIVSQLGIRDTDNWALEYAEYNLRLNNSLSGLAVTRVSAVFLNAIAQFPDCEFVPAQIAMDPDVTKWVTYPQNFFERIPPRLRMEGGVGAAAAAAANATNAGSGSGGGDAGSSCAERKTAPAGSAIWCQCSRKGNELTKENGCKEKKGCKWDGAKCAAQAPSSEGSGSSSDGSGSSASEDASEPDFLELTSAKVNSGISVVGAEVVGGVSKWERVGEAEAGDMSVTVDLTDAFGSSSIGQLRLHAVRGLSIIRFDTIGCVQEPPPGAERKPGPEPLLGLEPVEPEIPRLPPSPKVARKALMAESPQNLTYAEDTNMTAVYLPGSAAQRQYNRDPWDPVRKTCYT